MVGIGSTAPVVSLDDSQIPTRIALPGGSNAQRPTGATLVNGEIRYNNTGTGQVEAYYNGAWNSLVTSATLGTATPAAGSTGQVQFNSGGYLGASSNLFWNNSSGYLGIGTTSPQTALTVSAANAGDTASFYDTTPMAIGIGGGIHFGGSYTSGGSVADWAGIQSGKLNGTSGDYAGILTFLTRTNGSALAERMRIDYLGNVGIGTTNNSFNGWIYKTAISTNSHGLYITAGSGATDQVVHFTGNDAANYTFIMQQNGVVGIGTGTMSSSNKLEVNGAASIGYTNTSAPSNGLLVRGNVGIWTTAPTSPLVVTAPTSFTSGTLASVVAPAVTPSASPLTGLNVDLSAITPISNAATIAAISTAPFTGAGNSAANYGLYIGAITSTGGACL